MNKTNSFKYFLVSTTWFWLLFFALIPMLLVLMVSIMTSSYTDLYTLPVTLKSYLAITDPVYITIIFRSIVLAAITTFITLLLSYPFSYALSRTQLRYRNMLLFLVIIPFWTSSLIRSYAIMAILKANGLLNSLLIFLGIIHQPLQLLYTNTALFIGLVYTLIPFMILPLYASMEKLDYSLIEAAHDLGANNRTVFLKIILPLTIPGIVTGSILVFLPAMTLFYIPTLLGGSKSILLGNLIQNQFISAMNWPKGAAISTMLLGIMMVLLIFYWLNTKASDRRDLV